MQTTLQPSPRVVLRFAIFLCLAAFISIGHASWISKLGFCASMAFLLGSYRVARVREGSFERRMVLLFVPLKTKRWPLDRFTEIETVWQDGIHVGWALLIGPGLWIFWRLFDWIIPWMGGSYQLRLRHKGRRVLVWQGNSETVFQENLAILEGITALPVRRAG